MMSRRTYLARAAFAALLSPHSTASGERRKTKTTPNKAANEKPEQQDPYAFLEEHHEADEQAMAYEQAMAARFGLAMANSGEAPGRRSGMGSSRGRRKRRRGGGYGHGHHHGNKKRNNSFLHSALSSVTSSDQVDADASSQTALGGHSDFLQTGEDHAGLLSEQDAQAAGEMVPAAAVKSLTGDETLTQRGRAGEAHDLASSLASLSPGELQSGSEGTAAAPDEDLSPGQAQGSPAAGGPFSTFAEAELCPTPFPTLLGRKVTPVPPDDHHVEKIPPAEQPSPRETSAGRTAPAQVSEETSKNLPQGGCCGEGEDVKAYIEKNMKENTYYQHSVGTDVFKYLPCHTTKAVRVRPDEDILPANERSGYCTARILRTDEHYEQKLEDVKQGRCPQLYQRGSTSQTPGVVNCRQLELSEVVGKVLSLSYSFGQGGCACVSDKDQGQHDPSRVGHEPGSYDPSSDPPEDNRDGQTHDPAPLRLLELDEASIGEVPSPDPSQVLRPSEHFPIKKQELDRDPALKAVTYYDHSEITDVFHLPCSWRDEKIEYPKYFCYYAVPRDTEHDSVREYVAERGLCPHTKALPNAEHFAKYHYQRCEWTPYGAVRDGVSAAAAVAGAIPSENGGSCVCVPDVPIFGPADSLGPNPPKGSAGGGGHVLAIVGRT